jgi:hypothetical protein
MTVCPFCKAPVQDAHGPCPKCGKLANEHPSISSIGGRNIGGDFDDDEEGGMGDLDLGAGTVGGHGASASESYDGGGMTFDDDLLGDDGPQSGDLELDVPAKPSGEHSVPDLPIPAPSSNPGLPGAKISGSHPNAAISGSQPAAQRSGSLPASSGKLPAPAASSGRLPAAAPDAGAPPSDPSAGDVAPVPPPELPKVEVDPAAASIAKYPAAPAKIAHAPIYACRVVWRQLELRQDLDSLRRRRSPDVPLYERALKTYDKKSFTIGMVIVCTTFLILTVLFFMPVILRFANAPD